MAFFYNKLGERVDVSIDVAISNFEICSLEVYSDDISDNIFDNILTSCCSLSILTDDIDIYKGDLIGHHVTVSIEGVARRYTIVTNVADMSANLARETITIEAVDDLTLLKNSRYEVKGMRLVRDVMLDILTEFGITSGFGSTGFGDTMQINLDALWEDEYNTPPTKYDVVKAVCSYAHRQLYFNHDLGYYIFDNILADTYPLVLTLRHYVGDTREYLNGSTLSSKLKSVVSINQATIAASDRRISLDDPWQSAEINCKFDAAKIIESEVAYDEHEDSGSFRADGKVDYVYYDNYYGENGLTMLYPDIFEYEDPRQGTVTVPAVLQNVSIAAIRGTVERKKMGSIWVAETVNDSGWSGGASETENLLVYGAYSTNSSPEAAGIRLKTSIVPYVDDNNVSKTYLILRHSVTFTEFAASNKSKNIEYSLAAYVYLKHRIVIKRADGTMSENIYYLPCFSDHDGSTKKMTTGSSISLFNNITIVDKLEESGYKIPLTGGQISEIEIYVYPQLYLSDSSRDTPTRTFSGRCDYEWHHLSASIETSSIDKDIFETDTVYKWINDDEKAVVCSGNEYSDTPPLVTFDGKQYGINCVYRNNGKYYGEYNGKVSEEWALENISQQYATATFSEQVTLKGQYWFNHIFHDEFFEERCALCSVTHDIVNGTSSIKVKKIKAWQ